MIDGLTRRELLASAIALTVDVRGTGAWRVSSADLPNIKDLGSYTDAKHYKLPEAAGTKTFYGLLTIDAGRQWLLAFTSCRRFSGLFRLRGLESLHVVIVDRQIRRATDFWTGDVVETTHVTVSDMRPHSARLFLCE